MGYLISYTFDSQIDYVSLNGELNEAEVNEIIKLGQFARIQTTNIPTEETLRLLNELYYSVFPQTGFRIYGYINRLDFSFLAHLSNIEKLSITGTQDIKNEYALVYLNNLKCLELQIDQQKDFSFILKVHESLEQFSLETVTKSFDVSLLSRFKNLRVLRLYGYKKNIESLVNLPLLESLLLSGVTLKSMKFINEIVNLQSLKIQRGSTADFSELYGDLRIRTLQIHRVTKFIDINLVANLPNLEALELTELKHIDCLPDMRHQEHLKYMYLDTMKSLTDLSSLEHMKGLTSVSLAVCPPEFEPDCILPVLKNNSVIECSFYTRSDKKNRQINAYIEAWGKTNKNNFMTVRNMLFSNCTEF